jgi:hypothetical protein
MRRIAISTKESTNMIRNVVWVLLFGSQGISIEGVTMTTRGTGTARCIGLTVVATKASG